MGYNRFGGVYTDVIALYPGTVLADYGAQTDIEAAMDAAADLVAGALEPQSYQAITYPQLEMIVPKGTQGQNSAITGIKPIIASSVRVWSGQPFRFQIKPLSRSDMSPTLNYIAGLGQAVWDLDPSLFTVNAATGQITFPGLALSDQVFASYQVDTNNATFGIPSLARMVARGAAAELGKRLFSEAAQEWGLVSTYWSQFYGATDQAGYLGQLREGVIIPDEIRLMRWWTEIERRSHAGGSIRFSRG